MKKGIGKTVIFLLMLLLTVGTVVLRYSKAKNALPEPAVSPAGQQTETAPKEKPGDGSAPAPASAPALTGAETPTAAAAPTVTAGSSAPGPSPAGEPGSPASPKASGTEARSPSSAKAYNEKTYQLVSDLVYVCREEGLDESSGKIPAILEELEKEDPALAKLWSGVVDELRVVTTEEGPYTLPDDLPKDDSLCFAVLGFQLLFDGDMAPELLGRCETALKALQQYPEAFVAVTGGGTAFGNRNATEADVMAEWFRQQGIAAERIIVENRSMTTDQNAVNTCAILTAEHPQIRRIVVITSDYHMPLGRMMFTEAALLHAYQTGGEVPYTVDAGPAWATTGNDEYSGLRNIMSYVWIMADPTL